MDVRTVAPASGRSVRRGFLLALVAAGALAIALIAGTTPWTHAAAADAAFPRTIVDDEGTEVVLDAGRSASSASLPPTPRSSSRWAPATAWSAAPTGMTTPRRPTAITPVASFTGVDMEQLVALEPDLVLAAGNFFTPPDDIARMRELGYPVVVVYAPDIPTVLADIELIGAALGADEAAAAMTATMAAQFEAIGEAVGDVEARPRTFYQVGSEPEIYAPAPGSFVADMVTFAGGDPITTADAAAWSIPLEELLVADPEVIILGDANYGVCPDDVAARPGWNEMTAVVTGAVRPVDDVPVTRPGPRLMQGLAALARAIHPELELAAFPPDTPLCQDG